MYKKGDLNGDLLSKFADLLCTEIGSSVLDGVHWISLKASNENRNVIDRAIQLRRDLDALNKSPKEFLEVKKISNGYICDLDMNLCFHLFELLLKASNTDEFNSLLSQIPEKPTKIRELHKLELAKFCYMSFVKKKLDTIDVCLYNSDIVDKTSVSAVVSSGERVFIQYPSYKLSLSDLASVNDKHLRGKGMRISSSKICEILGNSVRVRLTLDKA